MKIQKKKLGRGGRGRGVGVHKGGQINNVQLITGLRIVEMSQRQGGDMYKETKLL